MLSLPDPSQGCITATTAVKDALTHGPSPAGRGPSTALLTREDRVEGRSG
jgi:hypothetical protein